MQSEAGRLSQSTIAGFIGAAAFAVLTAGTAVAVSTTAVSITNPTTGKRAHVTNQYSLVTSERDAVSGKYAKVDANGRQLVGEGAPTKTFVRYGVSDISPGLSFDGVEIELPGTGVTNLRMISLHVNMPSGQFARAQVLFMDRSGQPSLLFVPLVPQGGGFYAAALPVDLWPSAEWPIGVQVHRSATTGDAEFRVDVSGVVL